MKYFDSHAHYYDERFESECERGVDDLIDALLSSEVSAIINVGTSPETCLKVIESVKMHKGIYSALGIHPSDSQYLVGSAEENIAIIEKMITDKENRCVALGEIGLDYHYPDTNKACQMDYFLRQMSLAEKLAIPVVIHDREAHGDIMDVIRSFPNVRGVLHSYSGSPEMALELVRRGYMISFSGTVSFTNAKKVREVARILPKSAVLIETDCPYLTPHPYRGKLNHSGYLKYTNAALADALGIDEGECADITDSNARRFFRI